MHPVPASITVRVEVAVHCVDITRCFEVERNPALVQVHSINIILGAKNKQTIGITAMTTPVGHFKHHFEKLRIKQTKINFFVIK